MTPARSVRALTAAFLLVAMGSACRNGRAAPTRGVSAPPPTPMPTDPSLRADGTGDFIEQQMSMRVLQFAANLTPVAPLMRGSLPQGGTASHVFEMAAGHCYRIIAVGGVEVNDLDLVLFAPDDTEVDSDTQRDNYPVIGRSRPVCPPNGGRYRLEVRMYDGQGEYGLQIFGTP